MQYDPQNVVSAQVGLAKKYARLREKFNAIIYVTLNGNSRVIGKRPIVG
jgi:hypothetical protein